MHAMVPSKTTTFSAMVIALAASTVIAQHRAKLLKVAEVDTSGSVSFDGRFLSYTDWDTGNLASRDLKTGENRRLTNKGWPEFAFPSSISPDGQQVAYGWTNQDGSSDLRIIKLDGSEPRVVYHDQEAVSVQPRDWSPDEQLILAALWQQEGTRKIVLVSVADGSVRVLKSLDWRSPRKMSFSPDGRFIAYDFPPQEGSANRDIFVLSAEGRQEVPLVEHPANDLLLDWTPDGKRVLYASERTGAWGAWVIQVADGKPHGPPEIIKRDIGPIAGGLGFTRNGSYYYGLRAWVNDVYVAKLDPGTGKLQPSERLVSHVGFDTSVAWSPDGQHLAYASGVGRELYSLVLGIRSLETGKQLRFPLRMRRLGGHAFQPHWSPDGRSLLAQGRDYKGQGGLYRIDAETGRVTPVVQRETTTLEWPVWSPDGKLMFTRWTEPWPGRTIVVRDLETGAERELHRAVAPAGVAHLAVSPDGQRLAFVWWDSEKGEAALKVMPTAGGEPRELVKLPKPELISYGQPIAALAWTPDSRHLLYAPSTTGRRRFELWRISANGGEAENLGLVMEELSPYGLNVHPDGQRIAFTAGTPARSEVWVIENLLSAFTSEN